MEWKERKKLFDKSLVPLKHSLLSIRDHKEQTEASVYVA